MEKVIGELYKSGDKFFVTEEECSRYEMQEGIREFLMTQGYKYEPQGLVLDQLGMPWHRFFIHKDGVTYTNLAQYNYQTISYRLCSPEIFKLFYIHMFK